MKIKEEKDFDCAPFLYEKSDWDVKSERAYRRGFQQGLSAAIRAMEDGFTEKQIKSWLKRVALWRFRKHKGRPTFPEVLEKK